jgi:hypothetical protein
LVNSSTGVKTISSPPANSFVTSSSFVTTIPLNVVLIQPKVLFLHRLRLLFRLMPTVLPQLLKMIKILPYTPHSTCPII